MAKKSFGLKNFLFSFVIVCIVIYFFQNSIESVKTIVAEKGVLEDIISAKGIVVKDEEIYIANSDGFVTYYHNDGDKVNKGLLVADINTDNKTANLKDQVDEIEAAIKLKNNEKNKKNHASDAKVNDEKSEKELQSSILNKDLENVYNIVGQEDNNTEASASDNKYKDYDLKQLESLKNSLLKNLGKNKLPFYSNRSGIITYKIDGLEDKYKYGDVLTITPSSTSPMEYVESDTSKNSSVANGQKLFKIIRNFDYYIAVTVSNEYAKLFEENKYIKTRISSGNDENVVWGFIKKINYGSEQSVLIIYFDEYFYKVYDKRYVDLQLITEIHEGLKIDSKALCEKDGMTGVYVKDVSNIVKFFPVEILGQDKKTAIIYIGDYVSENDRRVIKFSEKKYETIKIFDKIVLEPDKVYEGQILK